MQRRGLAARSQLLSKAVVPADAGSAAKLRIAPGAKVFRLERPAHGDGEPLAIQIAQIPLELARRSRASRSSRARSTRRSSGHGLVRSRRTSGTGRRSSSAGRRGC
jgi:DNA-binding GntR family transcriptional regulator